MAALQRRDSTIGPLAFGGHTITLAARTTAVHVGGDARGALFVRARPAHVEVLDEDGRRQVVRVRDIEQTLMIAIAIGAIASACVLRFVRNPRRSSQ